MSLAERAKGEVCGSTEFGCSFPTPTLSSASSFSHHILSSSGRPGLSVPHSASPAFRPPPQASCLGDLLPAPQLPVLGMVTTAGPALHLDGPWALGPNLHTSLCSFHPKSTSQLTW